jgi:hypothetical protein
MTSSSPHVDRWRAFALLVASRSAFLVGGHDDTDEHQNGTRTNQNGRRTTQ